MEGVGRKPDPMSFTGNLSENYNRFIQRFKIYLQATEMDTKPDKTKIALLLNLIGPEGLEIYNTFKLETSAQESYESVVQAFQNYCTPKKNKTYERFVFNSRVQKPMEPFDQFLSDLKKMIKSCEYGDQEESILTDRIVLGTNDLALQEKLLNVENLSLDKATKLCRNMEITKQQAKVVRESEMAKGISVEAVRTTQKKQNSGALPKQRKQEQEVKEFNCGRCGTRHAPRKCPAYEKQCKKCGKLNHFQKVCRVKNIKDIVQKEVEEEEAFFIETVFKVSEIQEKPLEWTEYVEINNKRLLFKLDSGAEVNIMPLKILESIMKKEEVGQRLSKTNMTLEAYGGARMKPIGIIEINCKILQDLKYRLDHAKEFTSPLEGTQHQYGMNTKLLKEIVDFWRTKYNWREREKLLNRYPHYLTSIQGLDIHYIHVKPKSTNVKILPLLLLHGWPGSVREFYEVIPLLTTPRKDQNFVFEVIVPSIPGYGFSEAAVRPGLGAAQMAVVFKNLMKRLRFEKYYVQGGDFGAIILQHLVVLFPENVLGFHSNMCVVYTPLAYIKTLIGVVYPEWFTREDHVERVYPLAKTLAYRLQATGYLHIQATKPDTLGVALKDSPSGLAAYILEKFVAGTNVTYLYREDGGLEEVYGYANLLDNVMLYWITGSMPTAMRLYAETFNKNHMGLGITRNPVLVPTACARFKNDFYSSDGILNELYPNLMQLSDYEGGHFAAFQLPEIFAEDIFMAIHKFEMYNTNTQ